MSDIIHLQVLSNQQNVPLTSTADKIIHAVSPVVEMNEVEDGTELVITDVNGEHSTVIHDGYTPVKGVDYWTPEDEALLQNAVDDAAEAVNTANEASEAVAEMQETLPELQSRVDALENDTDYLIMTPHTYINSTYKGVRTSDRMVTINGTEYPYYWWSGWVDVRGVDRVRFSTVLGGGAGYAFRTGDILDVYNGDPLVMKTYLVNVPEKAEYFAFSAVLFGQPEELALELEHVEYHEFGFKCLSTGSHYNRHTGDYLRAVQDAHPPYEELLPKGNILCIGDSLTVGAVPSGSEGYGVGTTPYYEWLNALGSFPGKFTALAASGYSASDWYLHFASQADFTAYNTYLIWLGTNHGPNYPAETFAEETPGTETYYYRAIIEDIIAANPTAKIILASVFASKDNVQWVNGCIRAIADKYPDNIIGVTNFDDGTLFGPEEANLHGDSTTNPHFSPSGYFFLGTKWLGEIRRLIHEKIGSFTSAAQPIPAGFSPTVTTEEITGGTRVTITDVEGDHVFDIMDGEQGADAYTIVMDTPLITFVSDENGEVKETATYRATLSAYIGDTQVPVICGNPTGVPQEMMFSVIWGTPAQITANVTAGDTYGSTSSCEGEITIPITSPISTSVKLHWMKINEGAQGPQGLPGVPGEQGLPGNPPTITVWKSGTTTEINFSTEAGIETAYIEDGAPGAAGKNGKDGKDGVDGVSPAATVSKSGSVATISITDKNGTTTATVSDGVKGDKGDPGDDYVLTQADKEEIAQMTIDDTAGTGDTDVTWSADKIATELAGAGSVSDVQINGTSILSSGVANVPYASSRYGVVRFNGVYGVAVNSIGEPYINSPSSAEIKAASAQYKPITTTKQHEATFYGFAKAAGDATQSTSSNAVGTYTDSAKASIQSMLGVNSLITANAEIENGNASKAYAIGETFVMNGKLYKATVAIAMNDVITPGINCAESNVDDAYASKTDTVLETTLSRGRKANTTVGPMSFAFGAGVEASGQGAHAEGLGATSSGMASHAEGSGTIASNSNAHAEGFTTTASGAQSHAEGTSSRATGVNAHAEGQGSLASGDMSHAEGAGSQATGSVSHAEGGGTTASAVGAHAEGGGSQATGAQSHAEGGGTIASGTQSHAEGASTIACINASHASGRFNLMEKYPAFSTSESYIVGDRVTRTVNNVEKGYECTTPCQGDWNASNWTELPYEGDKYFTVGNGTNANNRSNAMSLDWEGNMEIQGDLIAFKGTANEINVTQLKNGLDTGLSVVNGMLCITYEEVSS